jgi:hypothetical protein
MEEEEGPSSTNSNKEDKNDFTHSNPFTPIMPLWQQYSPMAWANMYNEYIKSSERMTELYKELAENAQRMTELYKESAKSTERITKYWSDYFWKPLSAAKEEQQEQENKGRE